MKNVQIFMLESKSIYKAPSVNVYRPRLLPYAHSHLTLRLNCSLVFVHRRSCGSFSNCCSVHTETMAIKLSGHWAVHVGRRCQCYRLTAVANMQQWCVQECRHHQSTRVVP